jgi:hypothetical protein
MENNEPHQRISAARYGYLLCFRSLGFGEKSCWKREVTSNKAMTSDALICLLCSTDAMAAGGRRST